MVADASVALSGSAIATSRSEIGTGAPENTVAKCVEGTVESSASRSSSGASFTAAMVRLTVAVLESAAPSFARKVKLSVPLKSAFGV